jgi:DNA polymerase III subunit delta'
MLTPLPWLAPLRDEIVASHRGHALLLYGPAGLGHLHLAFELAQAWLCEADVPPRPCGHCAACRLIHAGTHPDLRLLLPEAVALQTGFQSGGDAADGDAAAEADTKATRKKPSREIKVDAIRHAIAWTATTPSRGRVKLLLIHPAQAMNAVSANALLKTLEEPGASVRLVLTASDPDRLLPTIRSRCQLRRMPMPDAETARAWLAQQGVKEPDVLLAAAGGRPLEAQALAADGLQADFWRRLGAAVAAGQATLLAPLPLPRAIDALQKLCHDAMALAGGATPRFLPAGSVPAGAAMAPLAGWSRELARAARHDEHPWQAALLVESLVSQGQRAWEGARALPRSR